MTTIIGIKCNKGGGSKLVGKVGQFWAGIFMEGIREIIWSDQKDSHSHSSRITGGKI